MIQYILGGHHLTERYVVQVRKRLLPIWWFTRCLLGSSKLRPFDVDEWWEGHTEKYQSDWEELCTRSKKKRKRAFVNREKELKAITEELRTVSVKVAILATIATAVLAGNIFLIKDGNPSLMWLVKLAFFPLLMNFFLLLILASPSFGSIYKRYISASDWQRLLKRSQDDYTKLMMLIDRYSSRTDRLKVHQIRAIVLVFVGCALMGIALLFR